MTGKSNLLTNATHKVGQSDREQKVNDKGRLLGPFLHLCRRRLRLPCPGGFLLSQPPSDQFCPLTWARRHANRRQTIRDLAMTTAFTLLRRLALAAPVLLAAQGAIAQETTAAPEPVVDPTLSMGTTAAPQIKTQDTAEIGELYLAATFELWEQRCVKAEDGSDPCRLYQLLKTADGNPTAEISMFNLPEGSQAVAGAAILVPLDTLLSANLAFVVDGNREMLYPYTVCGLDGCIARVGFSADQLTQMKNGATATLTIVPAGAPDQKVPVTMSLKGFTAGFEAVTAANTN